jgi:hypothetical protein
MPILITRGGITPQPFFPKLGGVGTCKKTGHKSHHLIAKSAWDHKTPSCFQSLQGRLNHFHRRRQMYFFGLLPFVTSLNGGMNVAGRVALSIHSLIKMNHRTIVLIARFPGETAKFFQTV